jgi:hypothetical protein
MLLYPINVYHIKVCMPIWSSAQKMSFFEKTYKKIPPWDIGKAQYEFVRLEKEGKINRLERKQLSVGCLPILRFVMHSNSGIWVGNFLLLSTLDFFTYFQTRKGHCSSETSRLLSARAACITCSVSANSNPARGVRGG